MTKARQLQIKRLLVDVRVRLNAVERLLIESKERQAREAKDAKKGGKS